MSYRRRKRIEQHSRRGEQHAEDERPGERADNSAAPLLHSKPGQRPSTSYASINTNDVIFHDTSQGYKRKKSQETFVKCFLFLTSKPKSKQTVVRSLIRKNILKKFQINENVFFLIIRIWTFRSQMHFLPKRIFCKSKYIFMVCSCFLMIPVVESLRCL